MKTREIKLFISDIDGVWTDGGMYYDNEGNEWKKFNTADSAGVLFLRLLKIPFAIITGENTRIVQRRADKLQVEHLFMGVSDKLEVASGLCRQLGIELSDCAYIGDDLNDIRLLEKVGLSACPANAPIYVKEKAHWVLDVAGGNGAFRAFVEKYLQESEQLEEAISLFHQSGKKGVQ
jgi:3-deoxy-D-manno-octulosonate 8-phosphate phosphatase (KDO 8-P phosphatase)